MNSQDEKRERHPAYGLIRFSRVTVSGDCKLFGSQVRPHTVVDLVVAEAEIGHDLSQDHYYAGKDIIRLRLSPAQFAELLTTMNVGNGVPCTLERTRTGPLVDVADIPEKTKNEVDKIHAGFEQKTKEVGDRLNSAIRLIKNMLDGKVSKTGLKEAYQELEMATMEIKSNMPFVLDQFQESTQKIVTHAKAEVDAFASHAIQVAGLEALRQTVPAQLENKKPKVGG